MQTASIVIVFDEFLDALDQVLQIAVVVGVYLLPFQCLHKALATGVVVRIPWPSALAMPRTVSPALYRRQSSSRSQPRAPSSASATDRRTAWLRRGLFAVPPRCAADRTRACHAGYATLPSGGRRPPCRSRTGRAAP